MSSDQSNETRQAELPLPFPELATDLPLLPARMLNEYQYCPRLSYLEWVQGEWAESADTVEGRHVHRRVDRPSGDLPPPEEIDTGTKLHARSDSDRKHRAGYSRTETRCSRSGRSRRPHDAGLFNETSMPAVGGDPFVHVMLIDGNDERGIDVGIMTRSDFEAPPTGKAHTRDL